MAAVRLDVLRDFREAIVENRGGEVVLRHGADTGRVFIVGGRIAWAVASTVKRTFIDHLLESTDLRPEQLKAVFAACKDSGANFGETIVEWGLLDEPTLRTLLLEHLAECFLELFCWPSATSMFVPEERPYKGSLTFELEEILEAVIAIDKQGRLPFGQLSSDELIAELHRSSDEKGVVPESEAVRSPWAEVDAPAPDGSSRSRWLRTTGVIVALLLIAIGGYFFVKRLSPTARRARPDASPHASIPRLDSGIKQVDAGASTEIDASSASEQPDAASPKDALAAKPDAGPPAAQSLQSENSLVVGGKGKGRGSVRIVSRPSRARIFFDGIYIGRRTPYTMRKVPAAMEHVLMVERFRYLPAHKRFKLAPDMQATLKFSLKRGRLRQKERIKVSLKSTPSGAAVYLNRRRFRQPTPTIVELHPRRITRVELRLRGHRRWRRRIRPIPDLELVYDVALKARKKRKARRGRRSRRR